MDDVLDTQQKTNKSMALILTVIAIGMFVAATFFPLWKVNLIAHNYPQGLKMIAYGTTMDGDLYELNIINHYVGMQHIKPDDIKIMGLFYYAVGGCILMMIVGLFLSKKLKKILTWLLLCFPIGVLVVIQYYMYTFGNNLDPGAPFRMKAFTPLVLGTSTVMNFKAEAMVGLGFILMVVAIFLYGYGESWIASIKKKISK